MSEVRTLKLLQGHTLVAWSRCTITRDGERLFFTRSDGVVIEMSHDQDCCEHVRIVDINGDLDDLLGTPIVLAEESTSKEWPECGLDREYIESFTWTFYRFRTAHGDVDIRWLGSSNGYYSERVDVFPRDGNRWEHADI